MPRIRVFEHQQIRAGQKIEGHVVSQWHLKELERLSLRLRRRCFTIKGATLQLHSYVGIMQAGDLTIEILPKTDRHFKVEDAPRWQSVLIDLLASSGRLPMEKIEGAKLQLNRNNLLDFIIDLFLKEIKTSVLPGGLPVQVNRRESKETAVKGQLLWNRQFRQHPLPDSRLWVAYDQFSKDHWINQVLAKALKVITRLPTGEKNRKESRFLQPYFPSHSSKKAPSFSEQIPARYRHCEEAVQLARLILSGQSPDIRAGRQQTFALLFDMNRLFESFIIQQLRRVPSDELRIYGQPSTPFWMERQLRPDVLMTGTAGAVVLDVKWKVLPDQKPEMNDLRQLYVYAQYFNARKAILLYPKVAGQQSSQLIPFHHAPLSKAGIACQILLLDLFTPMGALKRNLGKDLMDQIRLLT